MKNNFLFKSVSVVMLLGTFCSSFPVWAAERGDSLEVRIEMLLSTCYQSLDSNTENQYEEISPPATEKKDLLSGTLTTELYEIFSSFDTPPPPPPSPPPRDVPTQTSGLVETELLTEKTKSPRHFIHLEDRPWYRKKAEELDTFVKKNPYRAALIMLTVGIALGGAIVYLLSPNSSFSDCTTPEFLGMTTKTPYPSTTPMTTTTSMTTTKIHEAIDGPEEIMSELMRFFKTPHKEHILSQLVRRFFLEFCPKLSPLHKDSVMTPEEQNMRYLCENAFKDHVTEFGCLPEFGTFKNFSIDVLDPFKADEDYIEYYCKNLSKESLIENMEKMKNAAYKCYPDFGKDMPYTDDTNELSLLCVAMLTRFLDIFINHKDVIWNHLDW